MIQCQELLSTLSLQNTKLRHSFIIYFTDYAFAYSIIKFFKQVVNKIHGIAKALNFTNKCYC